MLFKVSHLIAITQSKDLNIVSHISQKFSQINLYISKLDD